MELNSKYIDRPPVAAGRFYTAHAEKLEIELSNMIAEAEKEIDQKLPASDNLIALVAPHAGYIFSGTVAAAAFLQLRDMKPRKRVFLIGSSHHTDFNGASIYNIGDYLTPFGKVKVDIELANTIINSSKIISFVQVAHAHEHALEVMLPFLQFFWHDSFQIIPIVLATHTRDICATLAKELMPYFNHENLFIISTDLSHYPSYSDALKTDKATINSVLTGNPEKLMEQISLNKQYNIPNLATSMCGWTSVLTLLNITHSIGGFDYVPLVYKNSGDSMVFGDRDRVVGYQSIAIYKKNETDTFFLSEDEKQKLIETARKSITRYLINGEKYSPRTKDFTSKLQLPCGAFVSLYKGDLLRGCIGKIDPGENSLVKNVADMAISSAFFDSRFDPVNRKEIDQLRIEISVITPLQKINSINEIVMGKHGIYIRKGFESGTYLPQVALKTNWTREEFLGNCSKNKAGLDWDGWRDADLYIYEAFVFGED